MREGPSPRPKSFMSPFELTAVFLALSAAISWINARFLGWPNSVAIVLISACSAAILLGLGQVAPMTVGRLAGPLRAFDFSGTVLDVLLAFLMFAGGMQLDLSALRRARWTTLVLATFGVAVSTLVIGVCLAGASAAVGLPLGLGWALVFGALISPTDPVAVLAAVRTAPLPKPLKALIQGESLFNDGVGILLFGAALAYASGEATPGTGELLGAMAREGLGGVALGMAFGAVSLLAMRAIDDYAVETGITVALATGVYVAAARMHVSGPIAAAAAGILVGGPHAESAMSHTTKRHVRGFWRLVDEILNSLLFLLLGLELLALPLEPRFAVVAAAAIPIVLFARLVSVFAPSLVLMRYRPEFGRGTIPVLTWSGVRGGLSVALALAVPNTPQKPLLLVTTYAVAIFSIVVQGLTLERLVRRLHGPNRAGQT